MEQKRNEKNMITLPGAENRTAHLSDHSTRILHTTNYTGKRYPQKKNVPSTMAQRIKNARKAAKISQRELAEKMAVTRNTVVNWEAGKYRPDADLMPELCDCLNISLNELFGLNPAAKVEITDHEWAMLNQYRQISPLSQRIVDHTISNILHEEAEANYQLLEESTGILEKMSIISAAGDGYGFNDIPIEGYQFVFWNSINKNADAIVQIKGDSMLPVYHSEDLVYVQYTNHAYSGEDVIVRSNEGLHIKRLGDEGVYSINKSLPFRLTSPEDNVRIIGRVLGVVSSSDFPSSNDMTLLTELKHDEIKEFMEKHHLTM